MNKKSIPRAKTPRRQVSFQKKLFAAWRLCASFCLLTLTVSGAELVRFPQDPAAWNIKVENTRSNEDARKKDKRPLTVSGTLEPKQPQGVIRLEVAQDESKRRYLLHFAGGKAWEIWELYNANSRIAVTEQPGDGRAIAGLGASTFSTVFDMDSFAWLDSAVRQDKPAEPFAKKNALYYTGSRVVRGYQNKVVETLPCAAWLDAETKLPLALDDGEYFVTYDFKQTAPETLRMPAKLKTKLTRLLLRAGFELVDDL